MARSVMRQHRFTGLGASRTVGPPALDRTEDPGHDSLPRMPLQSLPPRGGAEALAQS